MRAEIIASPFTRQKASREPLYNIGAGVREMTVYIDILFLINFSMDILSLSVTGKILHKTMRAGRICASAALGGAAATALTVVVPESSGAWGVASVVLGVLLSIAMTRVAFGRCSAFLELIRHSVILWGSGALLGGIMTYLLSLGEPIFAEGGAEVPFAAIFALCLPVSFAATRMFSSVRHKKTAEVSVSILGKEATFTALCDSGNLAREPISSLPVVIVAHAVFPIDELSCPERVRAVPLKTIGGERLLLGVIPDEIKIDGRETAAIVAVDRENRLFGGCGGIVPSSLCTARSTKQTKSDKLKIKSEE